MSTRSGRNWAYKARLARRGLPAVQAENGRGDVKSPASNAAMRYNSPRRAPAHCGVVNLVRSGTKQPQPFPASAADKARLYPLVISVLLPHVRLRGCRLFTASVTIRTSRQACQGSIAAPAGMLKPIVVVPSVLSANTPPPCILAIALTIANPRPWPCSWLWSLSLRAASTR